MKNSAVLHCKEATANKWWSYEIKGRSVLVKWGRVGLDGEQQTKEFDTDYEMQRFVETKMREKRKKGYGEVTEQKLRQEKTIAEKLGHQNKIQRMEFVDWRAKSEPSSGKLRVLLRYDPEKAVYIEIVNSWSKDIRRLLLTKTESWEIRSCAEGSRVIEFEGLTRPPENFVEAVRTALRALYAKVVEVVTQRFAALGARNLGDDDTPISESTVLSIVQAVGESASADASVVQKFAALGARVLEL
jgi:predicted DNA-binding WGR domain protein